MSLIVLADRAILPTSADTASRFTISIEPVQVFDYHDKADFLSALKHAIARGLPIVADPPEDELVSHEDGMPAFKNPVELKYASVGSWDELEKKSIFISIDCYPSQYLIESWGRGSDGKWADEKLLELRLPSQVGLEVVIDAIMDHLRNRRDLPGLVISRFQTQTKNGA
jgi:hypothetical protein